MRDRFEMTDIVGVGCAAVPHNDCGKENVGVTARFPDSAQLSVAVGGNVNRFIIQGIHGYLPQELVEQRFFFGTRPKKSILDFAGIFDSEDVAIMEEIIRQRRDPPTGPDRAIP